MNSSPSASTTPGPVVSRRRFLLTGTAVAGSVTVMPRALLGGNGAVAPSDRLTLACIGCGTQALRELPELLARPELQVVAVCDPVRDSQDYVDWSPDGLRAGLAAAMGRPDWRKNRPGIPGGREVAREVIETIYARQRGGETFRGLRVYADFRELLARETDLDAVWVITPDHSHATIAIAAMKRGCRVRMHKPLANRLTEARLVVETARRTGVATHFQAASAGVEVRRIKAWVDRGAIGPLREIHNWSNRPVWPQFPTLPTDRPPVPEGFDWPLWLGPSVDRPYHPHYTHALFRGWYEFGGGALADMGHYSLWPVFQLYELEAPQWVESRPSHLCALQDRVAVRIQNDYSFPAACTIRFHFAARGSRPALDVYWYDGGMKPPTPEDWVAEGRELEAEGLMFVGDRGRIIAGFLGANPLQVAGGRTSAPPPDLLAEAPTPAEARRARSESWIAAFRGGPPSEGDFRLAGPISDAFNLGAVSLRLGGRRLHFDAAAGRITNWSEANKLLTREYRPGWELTPA